MMAGRGLQAPLPLFLLLFLSLVGILPEVQGSGYLSAYRLRTRLQRDRQIRNVRPNIILILTDDQDIELGKGVTSIIPILCVFTVAMHLSLSVCFVFMSHGYGYFVQVYPTASTRESQPNAASWHQIGWPTQTHVFPLPTPLLLA